MTVTIGQLTFVPLTEAPELVGEPVRLYARDGLWVTEIDPDLADTAASCANTVAPGRFRSHQWILPSR
jgi:hypothetical protein